MLYDSVKETVQYAVPTSMVALGSIATGTMYDADLWVPVSGTVLAVGGLVGLLRKLQNVQVYEHTQVPTEEMYTEELPTEQVYAEPTYSVQTPIIIDRAQASRYNEGATNDFDPVYVPTEVISKY